MRVHGFRRAVPPCLASPVAGQCEPRLALVEDLLLAAREFVAGRQIGNGVVEPHGVVMLHLAAAGNSEAGFAVGELYAKGWGVPQNLRAALAWFRKAFAAGNAAAVTGIGAFYDSGPGVRRKPKVGGTATPGL